MSNSIRRFLFKQSDIRGEIVKLDSAFVEACSAQSLDESLRPLFGQFVAGACLVSEMLKFDGTITLQARGKGPISILMSEANNKGEFRGIVQGDANQAVNTDSRKLKPLSELIGEGVLALTLDPKQGQRYQGIVPLDGKDLAHCLTHYFEQSEQIPTHFLLFSDGKQCGGLLLQCLPAQEILEEKKRESLWETTIQLVSTLKSEEFFATDEAVILFRLFHELNCEAFEEKPLRFQCSCSRARSEKAILSLGKSELTSIIDEGKALTLDCHLCGKQFVFSLEEIKKIISKTPTLH